VSSDGAVVVWVSWPRLTLLLLLSPRSGDSTESSAPLYDILFIGNSLTYVNDLPGTVAWLAGSAHDSFEVQSVAKGGFALIDHVNGRVSPGGRRGQWIRRSSFMVRMVFIPPSLAPFSPRWWFARGSPGEMSAHSLHWHSQQVTSWTRHRGSSS
jgi:hypothetical protein